MDEVYEALQARELVKQMVSFEGSASNGESLSARGRTQNKSYDGYRGKSSKGYRGRSKSSGKDDKKFCKYCKKDTHFIFECYKLKNKEKRTSTYRPKSKSDEGNAFVAATDSSSDRYVVLVAFTGCANNGDEWILDSVASFHICINRDWFITYDFVQRGYVKMGDDSSHQIIGIGSVQIKMHDGIIRTLTDVRHIPDIRKNLISKSSIDGKGYKYSGESVKKFSYCYEG
jgi:hypothetical protein